MAKIYLNIEAEDVRDLHSTLGQLLEGVPTVHSFKDAGETLIPGDLQTADEAAQGEQTGKRTRRTKAQIEADNAAAAGNGSMAGAAANASGAGTGTEAGSAGIAVTTGQKEVDPFADQIKEAVTSDVTNAQVRTAMGAFLTGGKHTAKEASDILMKIAGVPNLGALDASHYPAALAAFEAG